jgi:hypothetical protein
MSLILPGKKDSNGKATPSVSRTGKARLVSKAVSRLSKISGDIDCLEHLDYYRAFSPYGFSGDEKSHIS